MPVLAVPVQNAVDANITALKILRDEKVVLVDPVRVTRLHPPDGCYGRMAVLLRVCEHITGLKLTNHRRGSDVVGASTGRVGDCVHSRTGGRVHAAQIRVAAAVAAPSAGAAKHVAHAVVLGTRARRHHPAGQEHVRPVAAARPADMRENIPVLLLQLWLLCMRVVMTMTVPCTSGATLHGGAGGRGMRVSVVGGATRPWAVATRRMRGRLLVSAVPAAGTVSAGAPACAAVVAFHVPVVVPPAALVSRLSGVSPVLLVPRGTQGHTVIGVERIRVTVAVRRVAAAVVAGVEQLPRHDAVHHVLVVRHAASIALIVPTATVDSIVVVSRATATAAWRDIGRAQSILAAASHVYPRQPHLSEKAWR